MCPSSRPRAGADAQANTRRFSSAWGIGPGAGRKPPPPQSQKLGRLRGAVGAPRVTPTRRWLKGEGRGGGGEGGCGGGAFHHPPTRASTEEPPRAAFSSGSQGHCLCTQRSGGGSWGLLRAEGKCWCRGAVLPQAVAARVWTPLETMTSRPHVRRPGIQPVKFHVLPPVTEFPPADHKSLDANKWGRFSVTTTIDRHFGIPTSAPSRVEPTARGATALRHVPDPPVGTVHW